MSRGFDTWFGVDDGGRCFNGSSTESLSANNWSSQSSEFVHAPVTLLHGSVDPDTPMRVNLERSWVVMIVDAKSGQGHDGNSTLLDEVNSTVLRRY